MGRRGPLALGLRSGRLVSYNIVLDPRTCIKVCFLGAYLHTSAVGELCAAALRQVADSLVVGRNSAS
jgi:hypothetical protein